MNTKYTNLANRFAWFRLSRIRIAIGAIFSSNSAKFLLFVLICFPHLLSAQSINIIPLPNSYKLTEGTFHLNGNTIIGMNSDLLLPQAHYLQTELQKADSLLVAVDPNEVKALIDLQLVKHDTIPGSYSLKIEPQHVTIKASDNEGIFYGIVSLLQLIRQQPPGNDLILQGCEITDAPRYQWRGFMLDEARHFFGKEKVKQLLDWMAFYKLNKLHWHLTDASGWRIEIKKYPKLTSIGAVGNHTDSLAEAKYYTQEDIKEIVAYARERFITVVPEIDMPGHAMAANKAYPEFSGGITPKYPNFTFDPANENVYPFLADVLKVINGLFPGNMIHLGGDEVAYGMQAWAGRPAITAMLTKNNFTSLADLEHYFFRRMADTVIKLNDKVLCWDEATETDLPAGKTIVFWWRQNINASLQLALQKKYQVVLCPRIPLYFDFVQDKDHLSGRKWNASFNSESEVYNFPDKQMPAEVLKSNQILGIQANLWTETVSSEKRLDFLIFPRMAALAEAAWTDSLSKNESSFNERLKTHFLLYDKAGIYYYNPFNPSFHPEAIDFAPRIIMPHVREKHRHHKHQHGGHHHHSSGSERVHHLRGKKRH